MAPQANNVKLAKLEERHLALAQTVDEIKNNHLVHLAADIAEVKNKIDDLRITMAKWGGGLAAIIILIELIAKFAK